jgi:hypothetical protein
MTDKANKGEYELSLKFEHGISYIVTVTVLRKTQLEVSFLSVYIHLSLSLLFSKVSKVQKSEKFNPDLCCLFRDSGNSYIYNVTISEAK